MHRCRTIAALAAAGVLILAGCGGGGSSGKSGSGSAASGTPRGTANGSTSTTVDVASLYQAAVRRADVETCRFDKAVKALGAGAKVRQTKDLVPPVVAAFRRFKNDLGEVPWPAKAKADAVKLQEATDARSADIATYPDQTPTSLASWNAKFEKDQAAFAAATRALRSDIGLLPLATSTCS